MTVSSLGISISSGSIVHGSPVQLVSHREGGSVGDEGEYALVLGSGRSIVEGGAA